MNLHNCRVVLVRPQFAGNVGATAHVMGNMGLTDLDRGEHLGPGEPEVHPIVWTVFRLK
jgi:hypothetical protein